MPESESTSVCVRTRDVEEAEALGGEVFFPHRLESRDAERPFAMSLRAASLGSVSVGVLAYSGEVRLRTGELETGYEINVPLEGALRTWTGHADVCAAPSTAAVYRPDGRAELRGWSGGGRVLGVKIERGALATTLGELTGRTAPPVVALAPELDLARGPGRAWGALAQTLGALAADPTGPLAHPMVTRPLAHTVIATLLQCVEHPQRAQLLDRTPSPGPTSVRRACELLADEPERAWTVAELAAAVGVGSRALQAGFARHRGTTPMAHLRAIRLRRVHEDLSTTGGHTVAETAARWGFTHLGRFAAAYRAEYGRTPSQTVREAAAAGAPSG